MKKLLCLVPLLAILVPNARAATVTGTIVDNSGTALTNGIVRFLPRSNPGSVSGSAVSGIQKAVDLSTNGTFSVSLLTGNYLVTAPGGWQFTISVPAGSGSYNITEIASGLYTFPWAGVVRASTADTNAAVLETKIAAGQGTTATVVTNGGVVQLQLALTDAIFTNNAANKLDRSNDTATNLTVSTTLTASNIVGNVSAVVNVAAPPYSADTTGATDASTAIQSAANAATGKKLYFPKGTYSFKEVTLPDGVHVEADRGTVFTGASPSGATYWFRATSKTNVTISGVSADGGGTMTGLARFDGVTGAEVRNIKVANCLTNTTTGGAAVLSTTNCTEIIVANVRGERATFGVVLEKTTKSTVQNSIFKILTRDGVLAYDRSDDVTIRGVTVDQYGLGNENGRAGIHLYGGIGGVVIGNTVINGSSGAPADTGAIRARDFENFTITGNWITNAPTGILCNQIGDFSGVTTRGTIDGNIVVSCLYSAFNVAGNCDEISISGGQAIGANTLAGSVPSVNLTSAKATAKGLTIIDNPSWGIYCGATGTRADGNLLLRCGTGSSSVPAIAVAATNVAVANNTFLDDRGSPTATLAIRIYAGASAVIGEQVNGAGITDAVLVSGTGTYKKGSAPFLNKFANNPSSGSFEAGVLSIDSGGKPWLCTAAGEPGTWRKVIYDGASYGNTRGVLIDSATAVETLAVQITSANNTQIASPAEGGNVQLSSPVGRIDMIVGGNIMAQLNESGVFRASTAVVTNTINAGGVTVNDSAYGAGWDGSTNVPTRNAVYDEMETKADIASPAFTGNPTAPTPAENDNDTSIATTAYVQTEIAGLGGGGGSVFVNGSEVTNPNFTTNAAITRSVTSSTNVVADINDADVTLTDAATVATDCSQGMSFSVTLGGNRTLGAPTNGKGGRYYSWEIIQDATGNRTLSLATNFLFGTDITGITLSTNATYRDYIRAKCDKSNTNVFRVVGFVRGYL